MKRIAIIHHLSSSGGTVFSKCIAAQPNVVLLSEVHPLTGMIVPIFNPIDPLAHLLANYPEMRPSEKQLGQLFLDRLDPVVQACELNGKMLVLRDHSHSDYLSDLSPRPRLAQLLADHYELRRVVTFRNPIDAYLSMKTSQFDRHLSGFDDYCCRALKFLDDHTDLPLWTYESFVSNPPIVIREVCDYIGTRFDKAALRRFSAQRLTGDSGRKPSEIVALERRDYSPEFAEEASSSKAFAIICARLGYENHLPLSPPRGIPLTDGDHAKASRLSTDRAAILAKMRRSVRVVFSSFSRKVARLRHLR